MWLSFSIVMSDQSVSPTMKLFIRFELDPIFWELVRGQKGILRV